MVFWMTLSPAGHDLVTEQQRTPASIKWSRRVAGENLYTDQEATVRTGHGTTD